MRIAIALAACAALVAAGPVDRLAPLYTPPAPPSRPVAPAGQPAITTQRHVDHLIPNSYIVVFKSHVDHVAHSRHLSALRHVHLSDLAAQAYELTGHVRNFVIGDRLRAYHGHFSDATLEHIRAQPEVAFVERDSVVYTTDLEKGAPWGLARLSHRKPLSFGTFNAYVYEHRAGEGVDVYVIDTGVNIHHEEFEGRAKWGKTIPQATDSDGNGHGTHVAGTIASRTFGVAKHANIIAVKVLGDGGSGSMADVIGGVDWATNAAKSKDAEARASNSTSHRGSVANMSLGGGKSPLLDLAVDGAVEEGLHFAVAAGNDNRDACTFSPAASKGAITVAASTIGDEKAYFSNHGSCVDIFAPGLNIRSTWNTDNKATNTISGTSMASPHIAGLAAYFLSLYPTTFSPAAEDYVAAGERVPTELLPELSYWRQVQHQLTFGSLFTKDKKADKAVLSPKVLKRAMIRVASPGILTGLPPQTIDRLAFNNATASTKASVATQAFMASA